MPFDRLKRREFITLVGGAAAWPLAAYAQHQPRKYTIGYFSAGPTSPPELWSAFVEALRRLGLVEGANITFERRYAENRLDRLPELAADLEEKRLEFLKEVLPRVFREGIFWNTANPYSALVFKETENAAPILDI